MRISQLVGVDEWGTVEGRPYVVYKYAATLDGRIAAADSTSQWITSPESRAEVHALRAACQATVVGSGTQQADDPHLAVRSGWDDPRLQIPVQVERQPWRVVVDTNARTPKGARVLDDVAPTLIAVAEDADARHFEDAATVVRLPRAADGRGLELPALLEELRARGVRGMFLEGGRRWPLRSSRPGWWTGSSRTSRPPCWGTARARSRAGPSRPWRTFCAVTCWTSRDPGPTYGSSLGLSGPDGEFPVCTQSGAVPSRRTPPMRPSPADPAAWNAYLAEGNAKQARKRAAADVLLRDQADRLLLVNPTYKPGWDLPGGMAEANESPHDAAVRELREELGHTPNLRQLLVVDWVPPHGPWDDLLAFVFDGGTLTDTQAAHLRPHDTELSATAFMPLETARDLLNPRLRRRLDAAVRALGSGQPAYLRDGAADWGSL